MPDQNDNITLAAKHVAQARAIQDSFEGKAMPAEAARQMGAHLDKAQRYRHQGELELEEKWLQTPRYVHDMTSNGTKEWTGIDGQPGGWDTAGRELLPGERKMVDFVRGERRRASSRTPKGRRSSRPTTPAPSSRR